MDFNKLKEMGLEYAEKGKNAAMDLAERGKTQAKIVSEQAKLAKAQRQLGALVYSLAKGNEENQPLVDKYIEMIDSIEQELASLKESLGPAAVEITRDLEEKPVAADRLFLFYLSSYTTLPPQIVTFTLPFTFLPWNGVFLPFDAKSFTSIT